MTRAYLRVLPDLYERKAFGTTKHPPYPPGAIACFVGILCFGEQQPERGRFKSLRLLRVLIEGPTGAGRIIARHLAYLIEHGDLIEQPDGSLYIEGWDQLQEGNWQVAERMARYRGRKAAVTEPTVTPSPSVTPPTVTPPSRVEAVAEASSAGGKPDLALQDEPEGEALTWLAKHGCYVKPGNGFHQHLVTLVEQTNVDAVIGMFDRLTRAGVKDGDTKGFIFGAKDALNPRVDLKAIEAEVRADEREEARRNRKPDPLREDIKAAMRELYGVEEIVGPGAPPKAVH